jgi:hypothetical protein
MTMAEVQGGNHHHLETRTTVRKGVRGIVGAMKWMSIKDIGINIRLAMAGRCHLMPSTT